LPGCRFTHLQQTISDASRTMHADATIPQHLMNWMDELEKECKSAKKIMSSRDEDRIRQCVDDLERIGDRAEPRSKPPGLITLRRIKTHRNASA
jgi:hypothetical protein